jgi:hypothetical protein
MILLRVIARSGSNTQNQLRYPRTRTDAEFQAIADAIEQDFVRRGWMK